MNPICVLLFLFISPKGLQNKVVICCHPYIMHEVMNE